MSKNPPRANSHPLQNAPVYATALLSNPIKAMDAEKLAAIMNVLIIWSD